MSWPYDDWEDARPIPIGAVGVPEHPEHFHDPHERCEGFSYNNIKGLTKHQKYRLNRLARRLGTLASCQHDLGDGVLVGELLSGVDGPEEMNELYSGGISRPSTHGLAAYRAVG